jgi:choline dehydrogenase
MPEFDFIVVGGGSAGCTVASRLSEAAQNRVLLIESGGRDTDPFIHIPATFFKVLQKGRDAQVYMGESDKGLNGRPTIVPQGHVLGGGSSVNAMIYIRGQRQDYDQWAQMGCRNWTYDKVLEVFTSIEGNQDLSGPYHGAGGPLKVSNPRHRHPLSRAFVAAAAEAGLKLNNDFNGEKQEGFGFYQSTTFKGRRWSAAQAFIRAAEKRPNFSLRTETRVARILFDGKKATGVQLESGEIISANKEIILCAGALATPKLLQLSGLGNALELQQLGISPLADLPGVGENYQDHLEATVQLEVNDPISLLGQDKGLKGAVHMARYMLTRSGLLSSNVVESGGFVDTAGTGLPDVQFHVLPTFIGFADRKEEPGHGMAIGPCFLRPQSRGTVKLRSANPQDPALFNANSLSVPADLETLVRGVELAIRIAEQPALKSITVRRALPKPGIEKDKEALRDYVRSVAKTVFHPAGTARMGRADDKMAVVTEDLKVRGISGLRVADASVMPTLVSGNTNAPCIMIGERAARFILGREVAG